MSQQVADVLFERLISWGVDTIFGFPGDGVDGLFEGLRTHQEKLKFIQVRHEEAAAFAALGYAKYHRSSGGLPGHFRPRRHSFVEWPVRCQVRWASGARDYRTHLS